MANLTVETLNPDRLRTFVQYCMYNDMQKKTNKVEGLSLLTNSLGGTFTFPVDKFEKLQAYLAADDSIDKVGTYAFVKLLGELRRRLSGLELSEVPL